MEARLGLDARIAEQGKTSPKKKPVSAMNKAQEIFAGSAKKGADYP
jgi:hypothetical protein